jgi:beta-glucosidase
VVDIYRDPAAAVADRVADLIGQMMLAEKLAQLGGVWVTQLVRDDRFDAVAANALIADGIGQVTRIGASTGLRPVASAELMNEIQRFAVDHTRLGVPILLHEESTGGFCARDATVFPQGIGLASTWDPELVAEIADVIRRQLVAVGARQTLAPVLDVARDPRWGRVEETYGEDPVLAGTMGVAYVKGLQTDDWRDGVLATAKHFLGYAMSEGGMNHAPVHFGPRELREVYAEPFAAVIRDADVASIMNSYSSVDGLACAGSREILTTLLREELGFTGMVVADYFSVGLLATHHHTAADRGDAAVAALTAGLDVELPSVDCFGAPLVEAIDAGRVGVDVVDLAVGRVLTAKFRLGLFDHPYVDAGAAAAVFDTEPQRALARRAVAQSTVLLTNADGLLPLSTDLARVAVIGPGADDQRLLQGDYHYPAHVEIVYETAQDASTSLLPAAGGAFAAGPYFTEHITPLAGLRAAFGAATEIVHAAGCEVTGSDRSGIAAAVEAAQWAEVAVVVVAGRSGLRPACTVGEARDASDLGLTGVQAELVDAVLATGTPTVLVVMSGRVHTLGSRTDRCGAVVVLWPPGEEGGHGLADVLVGRVDPSGRLPVSMPRSVGQVPVHYGHRAGGGRAQFYGDYTDSPTTPAFPFGHGLSYTTFAYGPLRCEPAHSTTATMALSVEVTNTGDRAGVEVVQLYGRDDVASVARPARQLLGFTRLPLEPGEARTVTFTVDPSRLAFYDQHMGFIVEPGTFTFWAGSSSADRRAEAQVDLAGDIATFAQRAVVTTAVSITD